MLKGFGLGLGVMYLLDPSMGRRRRSLAKDSVRGRLHDLGEEIERGVRDAGNRLYGLLAEARAAFRQEAVSEPQLAERVRARLGRVASHPSAIEVSVHGDQVTLSGPILAHELDQVLHAVAGVRGVNEVVNRLTPHARAENVPGLQGGAGRTGERAELMQANWAPGVRLTAGLLGGTLLANALRRPSPLNLLVGTLGFGLLARAATNIEAERLLGAGDSRRGIDLQKAITIDAPVDRVYRMWTNYQNFPHFMRNVREVRDLGGGRSAWTVAGPLGTPIRFNAVVTEQVANEVFAWKSEEGQPIGHAGMVRFAPAGTGTRVDIRMTYRPPAGAAGHLVASLFGADPKTEMDQDLLRMKSFLETGRLPHDAAKAKV
ncbi:MAG: SRPBCC family protein [Candidatus Methylomirabilales bacterium]